MSLESREDATRRAQRMIDRAAKITTLHEGLQTNDMAGLECGSTIQLERLAAENAADAQILARWFMDHPTNRPTPPPLVRPQIHLILVRPDSPPDNPPASALMGGTRVTPVMLEAAEDLLHTLSTGERRLPRDLYEVVARAFTTTREDAKARILLAIYGGRGAPATPPAKEPSEGP